MSGKDSEQPSIRDLMLKCCTKKWPPMCRSLAHVHAGRTAQRSPMQPEVLTRPFPPARPLPGAHHPDGEAFAAALASRRQQHDCAAEAEAARNKLLQTRRENYGHAREILSAIFDCASRQIASIDVARSVVWHCIDSAVQQVESIRAESAANRCVQLFPQFGSRFCAAWHRLAAQHKNL
jgi:hypothetical protein